MKSVALVTEYNPFHNGHLYHAQQSKSITQSDVSIAIMSGQFVMRGEPAIYNKFVRAEMALSAVDIVVELPAYASMSAGQYFANSAIQVADYLDANHLSFGSESGDIKKFHNTAKEMKAIEQSAIFAQKQKEGKSYPRILGELLEHNDLLKEPNNTLGLSYIQAINNFAPQIKPWTIQRHQAQHHDAGIADHSFASGTSIRNALLANQDGWQNVVPSQISHLYQQPKANTEPCFPFIKHTVLTQDAEQLSQLHTMSEGLEQRLKKVISETSSYTQLIDALKSKRYTRTHIQRVLMNVLLNFQQHDKPQTLDAIHILGMTKRGQAYIKHLKTKYPERNYVTNINKQNAHHFKYEIQATNVYNNIFNNTATDFNTPVIIKK
ncbi:nucleotidyltransferase [Staphylococcus sp. 18_1_E_LY]|uniref:tRNA(Met) cytidine acetate ligase n=1 Tax=Staphylococcus lloydii TaxID=2781774 RepID=A0A7T1AYB2_9STAP|nr:nucleotidyltransferase [Staphylococcus lloydii]MBF7018972.1 nucleotidyltransferase [Staphylococcus lloydii]MBF7026700.1 nucleotidyltransferase [Staphylococcus lloydii]QPM74360.1 nucleotidyltransferase [Staphylococcus lloydii]